MNKITFVRHTSVDVEPGICYGRTDVAVKPTFAEEAARVNSALQEATKRNGRPFDAVYRSPLTRCRLLAEACGYPEAIPDERLYEMNFGEWEMQHYDDIKDPRLQQWFDDWENVSPPGGESFLDQQRRVASFLKEMQQLSANDSTTANNESCGRNILVFTHAGVMMNAMLLCNLATPENVFELQPTYGSLLEINL